MGGYNVKDVELIAITDDVYINFSCVRLVELPITISRLRADTVITLILDNTRYQRCDKVINKASER